MSIYDQLPLSYIQQALMSQFGGAPSGGYVPISAALQQPAPQQQQRRPRAVVSPASLM